MKATRFISSRIFSFSKENLSSVVMKIAVISIALGISIMLISIAVIVGFKNQIKEKVVGFVNPIQIQALNQNESIEETPFIYDSVLKSKLDLPFIKSIHPTANKAGLIKTNEDIHGIVLKGVNESYDWNYMKSNLVALAAEGKSHFMVVCPASVLINWCREIQKFSDLETIKVHGNDEEGLLHWRENGGVAVTTFESISRFTLPEKFKISMVITDEAHYVKNPDTQRTKALLKLLDKTEYVLFPLLLHQTD